MGDYFEPMHGARYDTNGNIILLPEESMLDGEPVTVHARKPKEYSPPAQEKPRPAVQQMERLVPPPTLGLSLRFRKSVSGAISQSIAEGKQQLQATLTGAESEIVSTRATLRTLPERMRGALRNFWRSMNTPVTLPSQRPGKNRKPPTKLRLFIVDTVRFGGTFVGIFLVLFVGINYQSFWQIARAQLALGVDIKTEQALEQIVRGTLDPAPLQDIRTTRADARSLLAYLPPVGPFENRIIIPKIGKNVPIVRPSMDALMKEDWKKFEEDIQIALRDGVVHYPGSARPGQAGNFFITGHSSYYPWDEGRYKDVFARLPELVIGDTFSVYFSGDRYTYRVISKKEVLPNNVSVLDQPTDKRLATLMTCVPVGTTLKRLIVTAEEIDPVTGEALKVGQRPDERPQQNFSPRLEALPI